MATILRTRATWTGVAGAPAYSNLYWAAVIGLAQECEQAHAAFLGAVEPLQSNQVDWATDANVASIDSVTGDINGLVSVSPHQGSGDSTSDLLPPATQALCHLRTGTFQGGREVRGRVNIPYLTEGSCAPDGTLTTASQATLLAAAQLLIDPELGVQLVCWSRLTGIVPSVEQITLGVKFAVLRSRRD